MKFSQERGFGVEFGTFSKNLYSLLAKQEFSLQSAVAADAEKSSHWAVAKREITTLVYVNVIDNRHALWENVLNQSKKIEENCVERGIGAAMNVYILVGGDVPNFLGAVEFFGQEVYSIFWHLDLETGAVTVPSGQPKKFLDLRSLVDEAKKEVSVLPPTFMEIANVSTKPAKKQRLPIITYTVIIINAIILMLMYLEGFPQDIYVPVRFGAIFPPLILYGGEWYRLFTAMFVHFGVSHFAANALGLIIFGTRMERYFGHVWFLLVYVITGLWGSVASLYLSRAYSAGASGAIYGLVGFIFLYTRLSKRSIEFINWYVMFIYIGVGVALGFSTPGVDNFAHLGGLLAGAAMGVLYFLMEVKRNRRV